MFILLGLLVPLLGVSGTIYFSVFCGILFYFYRYVKKRQSFWKEKGIKHCKPRFLFGNFELFRSKSIVNEVEDIYKVFPDER